MRMANLDGRLALVVGDGVIDVHEASGGRFGPDPQAVFEVWSAFRAWADTVDTSGAEILAMEPDRLASPVPAPRQVFAIGLNYVDHAAESKLAVPEHPPVFTKFASCLTGPSGEVALPEGNVDWEVELVVVIGTEARAVARAHAWDPGAGRSVGQDLSERTLQLTGPAPQFSLGKSHPGFGPIGPVLVTPDELDDPRDLELGCLINGEQVQKGRTSEMVFAVDELIARLSAVVTLWPGDVIFSGTPAGVGLGRTPQRFLVDGDELTSYITGIGRMHHRLVSR